MWKLPCWNCRDEELSEMMNCRTLPWRTERFKEQMISITEKVFSAWKGVNREGKTWNWHCWRARVHQPGRHSAHTAHGGIPESQDAVRGAGSPCRFRRTGTSDKLGTCGRGLQKVQGQWLLRKNCAWISLLWHQSKCLKISISMNFMRYSLGRKLVLPGF